MKALLAKIYEAFGQSSGLTTDSRKIEKGCLFVGLRGERFDGNYYAAEALEKGAGFAVIDRADCYVDERTFLVDDSLKLLQELAHFHRTTFQIPIIAITGSNGKTTTKELMNAVLSEQYRTHCTKGNFNNHIGLPLTLLEMKRDAEVAIVEMGANHKGEIAELCEIAAPTHGLITNIGKAHLEGFGGIEGVKAAKSELYQYLQAHKGLAFVNLDEPYLKELARSIEHQLWYEKSEQPKKDYSVYETVEEVGQGPFLQAGFIGREGTRVQVGSQLIGAYNFNNIMTAITIGRYFKVPDEAIKKAIEAYHPTNNRSQILQHQSNTYILDAYNANPTSMRHALQHLGKIEADQKIAILGDMLELGDYSEAEHQAMADYAASLDLQAIYLVGEAFGHSEVDPTKVQQFATTTLLKDWLVEHPIQSSHVLIKGSRGIALERLLEA